MKNKAWRTVAAVLLCPICLCVLLYLGMGFYYNGTYAYQTYINGIYATGLTVETMASVLSEQPEDYVLSITDLEGNTEQIYGNSIDINFNYIQSLSKIKQEQNPLLWGSALFFPSVCSAKCEVSFDREKAVTEIKKLHVYQSAAGRQNPQVKIIRGENGYELRDDTVNAIDPEKLVKLVFQAVSTGQKTLVLSETDCCKKYRESEQMLATRALYAEIDRMQSTNIVYEMENKRMQLERSDIAGFLAVDAKGDFILDNMGNLTVSENEIAQYTERLSDTFDTLGKDVKWEKTGGGSVEVNNATFGCKVDRLAETEQIAASVLFGINQEREPFLLPNEADAGTGEIGDTYIEVDMSRQMLYYYTDGVLYLKTDVVTGATSKGHATPEKVCYVYAKQKNRTLRGANYAAFVNYWMPVYGNIGLHDAKWRDTFGGDIYENSGSHGCINLPREAAEKIYDKVEIGTPVIMYY